MMTMDDVCARWSMFSGWRLTWSIKDGQLVVEQPGESRSRVILGLGIGSSYVREIYGRPLYRWQTTDKEQAVILEVLKRAAGELTPTPKVVLDRPTFEEVLSNIT